MIEHDTKGDSKNINDLSKSIKMAEAAGGMGGKSYWVNLMGVEAKPARLISPLELSNRVVQLERANARLKEDVGLREVAIGALTAANVSIRAERDTLFAEKATMIAQIADFEKALSDSRHALQEMAWENCDLEVALKIAGNGVALNATSFDLNVYMTNASGHAIGKALANHDNASIKMGLPLHDRY